MSILSDYYSECSYLYSDCFKQYVTTKAVKRMETYKPRGPAAKEKKKLLLPVSLGPSSTSLLSILDSHLKGQMQRMSRTSYELLIVHIDLESESVNGTSASARLEKLQNRFPDHIYLNAGLKEAVDLEIDWKVLGLDDPKSAGSASEVLHMESLLSSISSATSKADIMSTLLSRLLVDIAKKNGCESILFGDSTTRLAEKTLTETAKGRGFSLPWQVSEGMSPYGINFHFPLRDVLKKELVTFSSLISPSLSDLIIYPIPTQVSASAKSTTIDELMTQYFESVEENYPSIVANVVRTSSKLKAPTAGTAESSASCGLCGLPVASGTDGIYGWGGDQSFDAKPTGLEALDRGVLCYGCSRSITG